MRSDQVFAAKLVDRGGQALGQSPELTKMIVERLLGTSSRMRGWIAGQMLRRGPLARPQSQPLARCTLQHPLQISHIVDRDST